MTRAKIFGIEALMSQFMISSFRKRAEINNNTKLKIIDLMRKQNRRLVEVEQVLKKEKKGKAIPKLVRM